MSRATPETQFASALSDALRSAASTHRAGPWESRVELPAATGGTGTTLAPGPLAVAMRLGGALSGDLYLCLGEDQAVAMLAGADNATNEQIWLELVEASADHLCNALAQGFGTVTIEGCRLEPPPPEASRFANLALSAAAGKNGAIALLADRALGSERTRLSALDSSPVPSPLAKLPAEPEGPRLHRVIDVPLSVSLRFGQRQLTLRELLELTTGSLVELDRQVEEPVDLMLGDRTIARGEVVIVDGNYGLRVTEVVENSTQRLQASARP